MGYNKAFLFLNGEPPSESELKRIGEQVASGEIFTVCADGALSYACKHFLPSVLVADFDSIKISEVPPSVRVLELPTNKDYTDGHVAMQLILDKGIKDITIYGGGGKRIDHLLSNLSLMMLAEKSGAKAWMDTDDFLIYLASKKFVHSSAKGKIISLVPYTDAVHIMYTKGLKYEICDRVLNKIHILGISNEATASEIEYGIESGTAIIFLQK